jgi:hypothetical protein
MSFKRITEEAARITILRELSDSGNTNDSILQKTLELYGITMSGDAVVTQLSWLQEQGLISLSGPEGCYVASITRRGMDVAKGFATVPGVSKPRPKG